MASIGFIWSQIGIRPWPLCVETDALLLDGFVKCFPHSVVLLVVGSLGSFLYRAVENARNAARSATTT